MSVADVESPPQVLDHAFAEVDHVQQAITFALLTSLRQVTAVCTVCTESLPKLAVDMCVKEALMGALLRSFQEVTSACAVWIGHFQRDQGELGRCMSFDISADHNDDSDAEPGVDRAKDAQVHHAVGELEAMYDALGKQRGWGSTGQAAPQKPPEAAVSCRQQGAAIGTGVSTENPQQGMIVGAWAPAESPNAASLFRAVEGFNPSKVSQLLVQDSDPNITDGLGETPLFEAVGTGQAKVAALLLLHGADPKKQSLAGVSARDVARGPVCGHLLDLFMGGEVDDAEKSAVLASLDANVGARVTEHLKAKGANGHGLIPQEEQSDQAHASDTKERLVVDQVNDAELLPAMTPNNQLMLGGAVLDKAGSGPGRDGVRPSHAAPAREEAAESDGRGASSAAAGAAAGAAADPCGQGAGTPSAGAHFEVVGGVESGIQVREGPGLRSEVLGQRLAHGSVVRVLERRDRRARYELVQGSGPSTGWITRSMKDGRSLLERVPE